MFQQWSAEITVFLRTTTSPTPDVAEQFAAPGMKVRGGVVDSLDIVDDRLSGVRLHDGTVVAVQALVVAPRLTARTSVLSTMGGDADGAPAWDRGAHRGRSQRGDRGGRGVGRRPRDRPRRPCCHLHRSRAGGRDQRPRDLPGHPPRGRGLACAAPTGGHPGGAANAAVHTASSFSTGAEREVREPRTR